MFLKFLNYQKNNRTILYRLLDVANQVDWVSSHRPRPLLATPTTEAEPPPSSSQFYRPLNVRVALTGVEIWSDRDQIQVDKTPSRTLNNFLEWRSRDLLPRFPHDNAQLVM